MTIVKTVISTGLRHGNLLQSDRVALQDTTVTTRDTIAASQDTTVREVISPDSLSLMSGRNTDTDTSEPSGHVVDSMITIAPPPVAVIRPDNRVTTVSPGEPARDIYYNNTLNNFDQDNLSEENYLNFLEKTEDQYFYVEDSARLVYSDTPRNNYITSQTQNQYSISALKNESLIKPDWLIGIIIACLVLFAWLKLFYNKFIDQTFISLWNFQLSENFQRDQSIFSRRVSMLLNLNFIITAGLFFYLVAVFFELNPWNLIPFNIFLTTTGIVALLLASRYLISHLSGFIFDHHKLYKDYLNQILIIYKIAGIVLIPLIMAIAYIPDRFRIYLIISGLVLIGAGILFRFVKGAQLIFKKDVSIFYLILYLCTLEFLPTLVIYKFFSSLV